MTGPHFGIIPRRVTGLDLTGADHRVLLVIACHARKETRIARLSIETIADEVSLDRRTVQRAMRRLEAKRILKPLRGGGRGRSSEYQIIFEQAVDATNSGNNAAVADADDTGNSGKDAVVFAETAAFKAMEEDLAAYPADVLNEAIHQARRTLEVPRWTIRCWRRRRNKAQRRLRHELAAGPDRKTPTQANSHRHFDDRAYAMALPQSLPLFQLSHIGNNPQPLRVDDRTRG
jgi:hypothetical protein